MLREPSFANLVLMMVIRNVRPVRVVLGEARDALSMTQREFGDAVGSSHRTAVRWDAGRATPASHHLVAMARLLYPVSRSLAEEAANHAGHTLQTLGIEAPPPPPPPPLPPPPPPPPVLRAADLVDVVVLAAVEATASAPSVVRPWLHAVFKRAREVGLSVEAAEKALAPAPTPVAAAQGTKRPPEKA